MEDEDQRKGIAAGLKKRTPNNPAINLGLKKKKVMNFVLVPEEQHGMSMEDALAQ